MSESCGIVHATRLRLVMRLFRLSPFISLGLSRKENVMFRYLSIAIALAAVATDIVAFASTTGPCNLTVTGGSVNTCACPGGQAGLPACVGSVVNTSNQSVCGNTNQESCSNTAVPIMTTYSCMTTSGANCTGITMNWNCVQNVASGVTTPGGTNCAA